jgi:hypothetical protein
MTESDGENARAFLDHLHRGDLSALLLHARVEYGIVEGYFGEDTTAVIIRAPYPFADAISALPEHDRKRIAEAVLSRSDLRSPGDVTVKQTGDPMEGSVTLLPDLIIHREMMISVATGGQRIQEVDDYYGERQARLVEGCAAVGIKYENPHASLWEWYHFWNEKGFGSWAERREYVRKLFAGPIAAAVGRVYHPSPVAEREPTGWELVDRQIAKARMQFDRASAEEDWQGVGHTCREVLISLAQAAHDPEVHPTVDENGTAISRTDARRLLDAWLKHQTAGGSNKEIRAHIRASLDLANNLQHRRTATRQLAALCLEATSSAVAVVAIIAGRTA